MIPKKIHYCWFGGNPLPNDVKKCIKSWKKYCPDYEIIEWNETNFDINCHPFIKDAYEAKAWAFVSDYARLKIVYDNGGIYLDTDVELLKNIDELLKNNCYFPVQQSQHLVNTGLGFGAEKNNKIIKAMLDEYDNLTFDNENREKLACPLVNSIVLQKYGFKYSDEVISLDADVTIYPPKYFDPIAPGYEENLMCECTYSIHHYSATWTKKGNRLKRKIINFIGQDKINKLKGFIKK